MRTSLLLVILTVLALFYSQCKATDYLDELDVELISISAGVNYWEAFGHSALRIKTKKNDFMYGFGYFNFNDEDFFLNFVKGQMNYFMGIEASDIELDDYQAQGRKIWSQRIVLSNKQKQQLINKLSFLQKPENRYYHYDYFLNNCTTKIRDILDEISDGAISQQLTSIDTNINWNNLTFPVNNQSWMNLGIAIAYGMPAYKNRNQWKLSIFPKTFSDDLALINSPNIKIEPIRVLYQPSEIELSLIYYNFWQTHFAVLLIVILFIIFISIKLTRTISVNLWLILQSLLGFGLLMLWLFTQHNVASPNSNLLLFFPLSFLLAFSKFRNIRIIYPLYMMNFIWLVLAILYTQLYLIGFFIINIYCLTILFINNKQNKQ